MSLFSSLVGFFEGRVRVYADADNKDAFISFLIDNGIRARLSYDAENSGVYTEISPSLLKKIASALDKLNIMVYIINIYGFKRLCSKYRERVGLVLGALIFVLLLWASTLFVWRVDVCGTELLSKDSVRAELAEMGVRVGAKISGVDRTAVAGAFLKEHPELSWAAINFKGTTVTLTVKETEKKPNDEKITPKLLVASESGVVRSILVYEGSAAVKVGTVVNKGDVLITGFISGSGGQITDTPPLRVTGAVGSVKAEVSRTVEVSIPFFEETDRSEIGERQGTVISVFGHEFSFGNIDGAVLESEKNVTFFGTVEIPVTVKTYSEQKNVTETLSRDSETARLEAERQLYRKITETLGSGELISVKTEYVETEDGWKANAEISCLVEIAVPRKDVLNAG